MNPKEMIKFYRIWCRIYIMMGALCGGGILKGIYLIATNDDASENMKIRTAMLSMSFIFVTIRAAQEYKKLKSAQEQLNRMNNDYER